MTPEESDEPCGRGKCGAHNDGPQRHSQLPACGERALGGHRLQVSELAADISPGRMPLADDGAGFPQLIDRVPRRVIVPESEPPPPPWITWKHHAVVLPRVTVPRGMRPERSGRPVAVWVGVTVPDDQYAAPIEHLV